MVGTLRLGPFRVETGPSPTGVGATGLRRKQTLNMTAGGEV